MPDARREFRFWRPDSPSVTSMFRLDNEDRLRTVYTESFVVIIVRRGAFDGWYRGSVRTHIAGGLKLKEPGEVHRDVAIHAPFTLQGAAFSREQLETATASLGLRGPVSFRTSSFAPTERAARLAFAMHAALELPASELERQTRITELFDEVLVDTTRCERATRAVRAARAYLHDSLPNKVTLDDLATHSRLDKFHLVRAFRAELGLPPYEYLTHARIAKAKELLQRGARVADAAAQVGFCDESQLHRHFRRIVGITPGQFARSFSKRQHHPITARPRRAPSAHEHDPPR
jgi:AraC-like DNA-binding protein